MALPSPVTTFVPSLFLLVDAEARIIGFDAPQPLNDALLHATRTRCRVESLRWSAPRAVRRAISRARAGGRYEFSSWELEGFTFDGTVFQLSGDDGSVAIAAHDMSELYELRNDFERFDALTRVWNRHHFISKVDEISSTHPSALLAIIDIDRFAHVNDTMGHAAGDALLRAVAERLRFLESLGHWTARLGGDEFACFLFARDEDTAARLIENVHQRLEVPVQINEGLWPLRCTIGYAQSPRDGDARSLLQHADIALVSAKTTARGSAVRYRPELQGRVIGDRKIEADLFRAIERGEFELFYQPVIDAKSGEIVATEALLRWNHPELGMLLPSSFLTVAEESDHVVNIGRWAMDRACRDAVHIARSFGRPLRLNVNVSPRHVQSATLVADVRDALAESGWEATLLQVEVTEQLLIEDVPAAAQTLCQLRKTGVSVAIDDFGTGYNTLSYLKSYPVSCLKIDRAFVRDAESDDYSRAICRSVTALAESLDMSLIGEGVETDGQARFLEAIGCRELQGFHFGRPVNVEHFIAQYR